MKKLTLFVGGPWHGREVPIERDRYTYAVPIPFSVDQLLYREECDDTSLIEDRTVLYGRRRIANRKTHKIRSAFVPSGMSDMEADRLMKDHLLSQWVDGDPDNA
jgi:hypothetical protein